MHPDSGETSRVMGKNGHALRTRFIEAFPRGEKPFESAPDTPTVRG
jgi:hypothetical protein